ncbi:PREDICTED: ATP-binding cassette sub-family G member 4 [Ceratosolen solmsi marchali]|uniref:ATP-binding cassette sub-family G member 4 n=1 Tax=Ceratosolen solmsi marchali TaxID=326594 RepID=A0AAJ7DU12_9HYME|nr:PREDICTED: ATP-binding cassette sub-family G member 4 [Ceratosolen solmsi marchali]XP_011496457.1 PREDICTED: ATP-binding cassette sub-family G member 4 [Ceratosolen solmsi marchali]XP_011496458.1 PREDICTED: ATP-binding cassette sub-family G member 4 [Ceratosolen solmsi marchali]
MADLKNLTLATGAGSQYNGDEQVQFVPGGSHQVTIRSPPPTLHLENLNNAVLGGSQNNLHCVCNGATAANGNAGTVCSSGVLARKVPNHSGASPGQPYKKPAVSLTHLPKRPPVDIEFKNLAYSVSEGRQRGYKTILKCVQGKFRSGELTAIMGPSGAGKSTLMNVLAGYKTSNLSGSVLINGKDRNLRRFRKMSCYIMQDDRLLPHLTVYEAMTVSANLKLGKDISAAAKKVVIEEIIETLGLSDASNTQTHCLSGGQRKRLSIALELVNNPPVMFFDEPTSGLDSSSCFQCLNLLKSLSRGGRTIICTIHQPSARLFEMFDHLYILAEGQCIYQGNVGGLVPFLSSMCLDCPGYHNPADYVMEVACGEHGECVHKLVCAVNNGKCNNYQHHQATLVAAQTVSNDIAKQSPPQEQQSKPPEMTVLMTNGVAKPTAAGGNGATVLSMPVSCTTSLLDSAESIEQKVGFPTNGWIQFWILLKRTFLSQIRDMTLTRVRLISHIIVGFLIGAIYYDIGNDASKAMSNAGCVFFTVMFIMFTAMMPTILTFPVEMAVFVREHLNYWYSLKAFYLARTLADIPFQIVYSIAYVIIVYFMTSQPLETDRFLMYLNICILTSLVAQSIGLLIGAAMSVETGVFIGPVTSVPIVLFSGFFVNFNAIPAYLRFLSYVSYIRYGFEGAMITVYGYNRRSLKCSEDFCLYKSPRKFLTDMSMDKAVYWIDVVALVGFLIALRIVAYFVLRLKLRSLR